MKGPQDTQALIPTPRARWSVACSGLTSSITELVEEFCGAHADYHYLGADEGATAALQGERASEPTLVLYSSQWLSVVGDRPLRAIQEAAPGCRVLLVGPLPPATALAELIPLGICGLLAREPESVTELEKVVLAVTAGQLWFSRAETAQIVRQLEAALTSPLGHTAPELPSLTHRENTVLRQVGLGLSNKEIAHSLGISEHTVKIHLQHIFQKLQLHRRTDLLLRYRDLDSAGVDLE